jgi:cell division protein ZapA
MKPIRVRILDHEYMLRTEEGEEQVRRIAEYVNEKLKAIQMSSEGLSERKAAILAAFHIASDYFQLLNEREGMIENFRRRAEAMIYDIDSIMG